MSTIVLQKILRKCAHGKLVTDPDFQEFKIMGLLLGRKNNAHV
jgi:hypothetical protein